MTARLFYDPFPYLGSVPRSVSDDDGFRL